MNWSFQLLLEVFCIHSKNIGFPIVADTFLRNEPVVFNYPFDFSYIINEDDNTQTRYFNNGGKFIHVDNKITLISDIKDPDIEPLEPLIVDALISRDKLMRS